MPATKEIVAEAVLVDGWLNRTPWQVIRMGVYGSTPYEICNAVSVKNALSPFLIEIFATLPTCGLDTSLEIANKLHSSYPGLVGKNQNLVAVVDRKLPNDMDYAYIFSIVIGQNTSKGFSRDLYTRCRMNFADDPVQTQTPQFMNLGYSTINTSNERSALSTPATRILGHTNGSHCSTPYHVCGEAIEVRVIVQR